MGGICRENLKTVCMMAKGISSHVEEHCAPDIEVKINLWMEFLKWGGNNLQTLEFKDVMIDNKEFIHLLQQIETE